jgi:hypothetical protein
MGIVPLTMGLHVTLTGHLRLGAVFTFVSRLRALLRRLFKAMRVQAT